MRSHVLGTVREDLAFDMFSIGKSDEGEFEYGNKILREWWVYDLKSGPVIV